MLLAGGGDLLGLSTGAPGGSPVFDPAGEAICAAPTNHAEGESVTTARFRLEVTNTAGVPISTASIGQQFHLNVYVEDTRAQATGLFAAYLDIAYEVGHVIASPLGFGTTYPNAASGTISLDGLIDEAGGTDGDTPLGGDEFFLFRVPFTATAPGTVNFLGNPADQSPQHDVLRFGTVIPVSPSEIDYGNAQLIIPQPPAVQIIDNGDAGYTQTGFTFLGAGYQGDQHYAAAGNGSAVASWTFPITAGRYRVSSTWVPQADRATNSPYRIFSGSTQVAQVAVNQELAPNDFTDAGGNWEDLATVDIIGTALKVTLTNAADEYVSADAVRIERIGGLAEASLFIPTDLMGALGETVTVPVNLLVTQQGGVTVSGADLAIEYDATKFTVVENSFRVGSLLGGAVSGFTLNVSPTPGLILVALSKATGPALALDEVGPVFEFDLTVIGAPNGVGSPINLLENYSTTTTQVIDNDITELALSPPPTNADSDSIDGTFTIKPPVVTLSVDNATISEAAGITTFSATLSTVSDLPVTVDLGLSGTAVGGGADYTTSATQISIPAGQLTGSITVTAVQDPLEEADETVIVEIAGVTNATESGTQQQTTTITDDDELPVFTKSFGSDTIGPGSVSTLQFEITNFNPLSPLSDLAFTDVLPTNVSIATPANATSTCEGTLSAPNAGSIISFGDGRVGAAGSCSILVDVTSSVVGVHTNISGNLTSNAGSSGTATGELTVSADRPGFTKSFAPPAINLGSRSTLTLTIDNTANGSISSNLTFTDELPIGLVIADPAGIDTDCTGGTLTAVSGSSVVSYGPAFPGDASVAANSTCTIKVDLIGGSVGLHSNTTSDLTSTAANSLRSSGKANAAVHVTADRIHLTKSFQDDPVPPGGMVTTEFTITNFDRSEFASDIAFTEDLDTNLDGLVAVGLPLAEPCGEGSVLTGTSLLTLSGGHLGPGESCTFTAGLQVPGTAAGIYTSTTGSITAKVGGVSVVGAPGRDDLFVQASPILTKEFIDDPVGSGGTVSLEFTITNTDQIASAIELAFTDELPQVIVDAVSPPTSVCNGGTLTFKPLTTPPPPDPESPDMISLSEIAVSGASLAPGASCSFTVELELAVGFPGGAYKSTTRDITATIDDETVVGDPASDILTVVEGPKLMVEFTDDPAAAGGITNLQFTITYGDDEETAGDAVSIEFTDSLDGVIAGLAATGLPMDDVCGLGSQINGTDSLSFTGGSLAPGSSCTFNVPVQVPATASPGSHINTTSNIAASVLGVSTVSAAAEDDLQVVGLTFTKEFTNDPVPAGSTVTLQFTITNATADLNATNISFSDNLDDSLAGLVATGLPLTNICGVGSGLTGTSVLMFNGGSLDGGESCTFSVTLQVPANAASDSYNNTTGPLLATFFETPTLLPPATGQLIVASDLLLLGKAFVEDSASPGDTVTLGFTLTNLDATRSVTEITFIDDLEAALAGLTAVGLPAAGVCGAGSQLTGTSLLTLTGGNLEPGGSCNFNVTLQLPTAIAFGAGIDNATSVATGTIGGLPVNADPASDSLLIDFLDFGTSFDGPTDAGGTPTLTFTIHNPSASATISGLAFSDDLNAALAGLTATGLPASNICGAGSKLNGTSFLTMMGGSLGPGGSCSFNVNLLVPAAAPTGSHSNTTSSLFSSGIPVAVPAHDTLVVFGPPAFSQRFAPDAVALGKTSTLTFTIDNTANAISASNLDFTDNVPAGLVIAATPNASTDCSGGVLIAAAGTRMIDYSGGSVAAGAGCTVQVDVTGVSVGSHLNTSDNLTSSLGNSGPASDTLEVNVVLAFDQSFLPGVIGVGSVSTLTFDIDNLTGNPIADLSFNDNLPAGVAIASPTNASSTCGGTLSAPSGGSTIALTAGGVAAAGSCSVSVDVTSSIPETYTNVTSQLYSTAGNAEPAAADLIVSTDRPGFTKSFSPSSVAFGARSTLTFTINNSANEASTATELDFSDNLPPGIVIAAPANASKSCSGGLLTAVPGTDVIRYTQGALDALASCTITIDVIGRAVGLLGNTSSELTSNLGPSGQANAVLEVTGGAISLIKSFTDDPVLPGGTATMQFVITNFNRDQSATNITLTDNLDATLSGLLAVGLPSADVCGTGSELSGTSLVTLSGASLGPGESCTFSTTLQVPPFALTGVYPNTTGSITAKVGGKSITGVIGSDHLFVQTTPILTTTFTDDPVGAGGAVNLNFNIQNTSNTSTAVDIAFTDILDAVLPGLTVAVLPPVGFCGTGSSLVVQGSGGSPLDGEPFDSLLSLVMSGGNLSAGGSCSFDVTLLVPAGASGGKFANKTSSITAVVDDLPLEGNPASDDLMVVAAPVLRKEFTEDPVLPGANATLQFTLTYGGEGDVVDAGDATNIYFTDDLNAALAGLTAIGLPINDVCGTGSRLSGATNLSFTGGTLTAGSTCNFSVPVFVPLATPAGSYTSETSSVTATVDHVITMNGPATDDLRVAGLAISKEFTDDPVPAGGMVTLQFKIENLSQVAGATSISFTDNLDDTLAGLASTDAPRSDVCGTGSQLTGTSVLELTGGTLAAGESCTFSVTLQVPASANSDVYVNTTSNLDAVVDATPVSLEPATDTLIVASDVLLLDKTFAQDSAFPGDTVTLDFTITNLDASHSVTDIAFADDLDAALSGLVVVGLPASNVCGPGSQLQGSSLLTLTGGTLGPGESCGFSTTLQLPANIPFGSSVDSITSEATGDLGGLQVTGDPARDDLRIDFFQFSKSFNGLTYAGGTPTLSFTIENLRDSAVGDLSFSDDLSGVIPGLAAVGLPANGVCGAGSQLAGTSILTFRGGNLLPGGSCTFDVMLQVPLTAAPGAFTNQTGDLLVAGTPGASPAVDALTVVPPPEFDKVFTPAGIPLSGTTTLIFSINNSASPLGATSLAFAENLLAGVTVAASPNASSTCIGGTLTAAGGSNAINYFGGAVAAGASCSVQVDVTSSLSGSHLSVSGDLTSLLGNSGPASATLTSQIVLMGGPLTPGENMLTASEVLSGATVVLVGGTQPGSAPLTVQDVVITTAFADPVLIGDPATVVNGSATFVVSVTETQVGQTLQFQAFQITPILDASDVLLAPVVVSPLLAEGGQAVLVHGESTGAIALTAAMLRSVSAAAIERWKAIGLTQAEINLLHSVAVRIADLPDGMLGQTVGTTISIDYSAAGYGWFVDETPDAGTEFGATRSQTESGANAGGPADQRMDLYTAVLHEFGHVLKFDDAPPNKSLRGVMTATLPAGIRRLPTGWQNPSQILDVNDDRFISPLDALIVVNEVNAAKFRDLEGRLPSPVPQRAARWFFDTNGDGFATALDALRIINYLNGMVGVAEGEALPQGVDLALLDLQAERQRETEPVPCMTVSGDNANPDAKLVPRNVSSRVTKRDLQFATSDAKSVNSDLALLEWLTQKSSHGH